MTTQDAIKLYSLLGSDGRVFDLETDSLLRQAGNQFTATALLMFLKRTDIAAPGFAAHLRQFIRECSLGDPSVLIGFNDGSFPEQQKSDSTDESATPDSPCDYWLRVTYTSNEASFYLFHSAGSILTESPGITGSSRKREDAFHHVHLELSAPRFLEPILRRIRECPHVSRIEESSAAAFRAAPSHSPGY